MPDIRTKFVDFDIGADLVLAPLGLEEDDGLETAVVLSLFTDRRAEPDDVIPDGTEDRRGWWADSYPAIDGDKIGSRLWLLHREKQLQSVVNRAREYAEESLRWLIDDGVVRAIDVGADIIRTGVLGLTIQIHRSNAAPVKFRYEQFWGAT